jgi:hypothetical protein
MRKGEKPWKTALAPIPPSKGDAKALEEVES